MDRGRLQLETFFCSASFYTLKISVASCLSSKKKKTFHADFFKQTQYLDYESVLSLFLFCMMFEKF